MNRNKIILIAAVTTVVVAAQAVSFYGSEGALMERFPEINPDLVKKAHRRMYRAALTGAYSGIDLTDEACDKIFLSTIETLKK